MNTEHVARTFVEYYEEHGHRRITGSTPLPPPGDPVLFTTSGMHLTVFEMLGTSPRHGPRRPATTGGWRCGTT